MNALAEEIDELLSRAKYLEKKQPKTPMTPEYWGRLQSLREQAARACPDTLQIAGPDESQKSWDKALPYLQELEKTFRNS